MDWLVVEGVRPWDGRYEFDIETRPFTTREWGWIKRFSHYLPLTVIDGWQGGDPELFAAFAVIALYRAGRIQPGDAADIYDRFADAPFGGTIRLEADSVDREEPVPDPPGSSDASSSTNGNDSKTSSETSDVTLPDSGTPDWASLASHHTRLPT